MQQKIVEHKDIREVEITGERRGRERVERWRRRLGRGRRDRSG